MDYSRNHVPSHPSTTPVHNEMATLPYSPRHNFSPRRSSVSTESGRLPLSSPNGLMQHSAFARSTVTVNVPSPQRQTVYQDYAPEPVVSDVSSQANNTLPAPASESLPSRATTTIASPMPAHAYSSPNRLAPGQKPRGRPKGWKPGLSYSLLRSGTRDEINAAKKTLSAHPKLIAAPSRHRLVHGHSPSGTTSRAQPREGIVPVNYSLKPKRRGRPPKRLDPPATDIWARFVDPQYVTFQCEWQGCRAELQNWDTLQRHLRAVHCRGETMTCEWGACELGPAKLDESEDELGGDQSDSSHPKKAWKAIVRRSFVTGEQLKAHIDEAHLIPLLWHVGDGPKNQSGFRCPEPLPSQIYIEEPGQDCMYMAEEKDGVPDYLFNDKGEQVTPWVKYQELEDLHTYRENRRKLRELKAWLQDNLPSDGEDQDRPLQEA